MENEPRHHVAQARPGILTNHAKDIYFAPKISQLTACGAEDLSSDASKIAGCVPVFVLNSMLRVSLTQPARQHVFNFLRKVQGAFADFGRGREHLQAHIGSPEANPISQYLLATNHFEHCLSQTYQAYMLGRGLIQLDKLFTKGDGSAYERLNLLHNRTKHIDKAIAAGQLPPEGTLPVWITNEGLETPEAALKFDELAGLLRELARMADYLSNLPDAAKPPDAP